MSVEGAKRHNTQVISAFIEHRGFNVYGFGWVGDILQHFPDLSSFVVENLHYAICIGVVLSAPVIEEICDHPTKTYFYHYRRANITLDDIAVKLTSVIQTMGYNAFPVPSSFVTDWKEQRGHISHKAIGVRCGLGWIGRNNLLVHPKYGSRVRYVSILTDMPLSVSEPLKQGCGACNACISTCPAGAIVDNVEGFDRWSCLEKLKFFAKRYNIGHYICGICVKSCKGEASKNG